MEKLLPGLILVLLWSTSLAQTKPDSTHFIFDYTSTGALNKTQNSSSFLLNNGFNSLLKERYIGLTLEANYLYGQQNGKTTNKDFSSTFNLDEFRYAPFKHTYYWALIDYNTIYSLNINYQKEIGVGLAYLILSKPDAHLSISDGILYDKSNFFINTEHDVYRNSVRIKYHLLLNKIFQLDGIGYLQNAFGNAGDNVIKSKTTASFKVGKWLSVGSTASFNKSSFVQRQNFLLTYGFFITKNL